MAEISGGRRPTLSPNWWTPRADRCQHPTWAGRSLERRSISEQVANRIMAMIKSGNLKAGDRLPTEQQMGVAFGISRPPLREALKALTLMGMLESRQGGRYTVTDLSPSRLVAPFNVMLSVGDYDVHEHFEAREAVELTLVRFATLRATPEERSRILKHAVDGKEVLDDPVAFRLLDIEFHQRTQRCRRATSCCRRWRRASTTSASTCGAPPARCRANVEKSVGAARRSRRGGDGGRRGRSSGGIPAPSRTYPRHDHRGHFQVTRAEV